MKDSTLIYNLLDRMAKIGRYMIGWDSDFSQAKGKSIKIDFPEGFTDQYDITHLVADWCGVPKNEEMVYGGTFIDVEENKKGDRFKYCRDWLYDYWHRVLEYDLTVSDFIKELKRHSYDFEKDIFLGEITKQRENYDIN